MATVDERRREFIHHFFDGVPLGRLTTADTGTAMFLAYLKGDDTAALAFADEVQTRCSPGRVRLGADVYVGYTEQLPPLTWEHAVSTGSHAGFVVAAVGAAKYRTRRWMRDAANTLAFSELCAYTERALLSLRNVGPVRVRYFREWLRDRGLRPAGV